MPVNKIGKARKCVASALSAKSLNRPEYRSLLGRLRHVATCTVLQRLRQHERSLQRWDRVPVSKEMQLDLSHTLLSQLNGVPRTLFRANPAPDIVVEMDASDSGLAQTIIRLLGHWEVEYGLRVSSAHIAGADNEITDAGSRRTSSTTSATIFYKLTSGWMQVSPTVDVSGLERIWHSISEPSQSLHQRTASITRHLKCGTAGQHDAELTPL
ncbi:hypothetical protein GQ600_3895 [Phytophthora cactorum]|nr:hypothetical protein GQ600_3895 [Phytophthora cactorum]